MGRPPVGRITLACATVLALFAPEANAYVRTLTSANAPMYWNRTVITITAYLGDPPDPLSTQDVLYAAQSAAATWSRDKVGCTSIELRVASSQERSAKVLLDGVPRMTFRRETWCKDPHAESEPCYDPLALAVTSVFARKGDGEIIDADVELNAVTFKWADLARNPGDGGNIQDLQNTLTHEFGHLIGLDHTCFIAGTRPGAVDDRGQLVPSCGHASDEIRATTMFAAVVPGDLDRRSLSPDDRRGVCEIYPPVDLTLESGRGCSVAPAGGGAAGWGILLLALGLARRFVRRRRR
jgi:MYXO-CTERM domain-containing protein